MVEGVGTLRRHSRGPKKGGRSGGGGGRVGKGSLRREGERKRRGGCRPRRFIAGEMQSEGRKKEEKEKQGSKQLKTFLPQDTGAFYSGVQCASLLF